MKKLRIAVVGCGLGGAAIAALLLRLGFDVSIYEQTERFQQIGAGIHLTPNMLMALEGLGVEDTLLKQGYRPNSYVSRDAASAEVLFRLPLANAEAAYGGAYLTIPRYEFHQTLVSALRGHQIHYGMQLGSIEQNPEGLILHFVGGASAECDLLIGADGLSSVVRRTIRGDAAPAFSGHVAYRSVIPATRLPRLPEDDYSKWWADGKFVVAYYMTPRREHFYFVAGFKAAHWPASTPRLIGSREELLSEFSGFHPHIRDILESSQDFTKWPLFERAPGPSWHCGRIVLLGDACHPMKPHMAQGAAMAIEDGVVLARCLMAVAHQDWESAFSLYEKNRVERVSHIQSTSNNGSWFMHETDPGWLFSYDAWKSEI
ncbi:MULTISPECIES: FAD-dependent monooxygenase [Gammaproteobacteria]|uniref:FAD-dependent monooxygenase n=1 Tax=Gammaproteobacteria TaxID=1236 RepID=UPI000F560218|nr:FAD-dependent monooxygenase [Pseudomonas chlororaphis]AZD84284.1 putative oxidoreductase [Pseudomonas chlororaphis subsp. aureofaciens]